MAIQIMVSSTLLSMSLYRRCKHTHMGHGWWMEQLCVRCDYGKLSSLLCAHHFQGDINRKGGGNTETGWQMYISCHWWHWPTCPSPLMVSLMGWCHRWSAVRIQKYGLHWCTEHFRSLGARVRFSGYIRHVADIKYIRATNVVVVEPVDKDRDASEGGPDEEITIHPWRET